MKKAIIFLMLPGVLVIALAALAQISRPTPPDPVKVPTVSYPALPLGSRISGVVQTTLTVEQGKVIKTTNLKSAHDLLTIYANQYAKAWEFPPDFSGEYEASFVFILEEGLAPGSQEAPKQRSFFTGDPARMLVVISEIPPIRNNATSRK